MQEILDNLSKKDQRTLTKKAFDKIQREPNVLVFVMMVATLGFIGYLIKKSTLNFYSTIIIVAIIICLTVLIWKSFSSEHKSKE